MGVELDRGKVHDVDLRTGQVQKVSETSTASGGVSAWVFEGALSGVFGEARTLFMRGVALINWMLTTASEAPDS